VGVLTAGASDDLWRIKAVVPACRLSRSSLRVVFRRRKHARSPLTFHVRTLMRLLSVGSPGISSTTCD